MVGVNVAVVVTVVVVVGEVVGVVISHAANVPSRKLSTALLSSSTSFLQLSGVFSTMKSPPMLQSNWLVRVPRVYSETKLLRYCA